MRKFFYILNVARPRIEERLTDSEVNLIAEFCILPPKYRYHRFSHSAKLATQRSLLKVGWKVSLAAMRTKIYSLIDKGVLLRDEDNVITLSPSIEKTIELLKKAHEDNKEFDITFRLKIETSDDYEADE